MIPASISTRLSLLVLSHPLTVPPLLAQVPKGNQLICQVFKVPLRKKFGWGSGQTKNELTLRHFTLGTSYPYLSSRNSNVRFLVDEPSDLTLFWLGVWVCV